MTPDKHKRIDQLTKQLSKLNAIVSIFEKLTIALPNKKVHHKKTDIPQRLQQFRADRQVVMFNLRTELESD